MKPEKPVALCYNEHDPLITVRITLESNKCRVTSPRITDCIHKIRIANCMYRLPFNTTPGVI